MRSTKILLATIFLTSLVFAQAPAAAPVPSTNAKSSAATVYVYRYKQFVGSALEPSVYCDDTQLARMSNGRYFTVKIDPGKHTFTSNDKQSGIELEAKAGQEYFMRVELVPGMMKGHGRLILMSAEQGAYELKSDKLKPIDAGKVANAAMVSTDVAHPGMSATSSQATQPAPKVVEVSSPEHNAVNPQ